MAEVLQFVCGDCGHEGEFYVTSDISASLRVERDDYVHRLNSPTCRQGEPVGHIRSVIKDDAEKLLALENTIGHG